MTTNQVPVTVVREAGYLEMTVVYEGATFLTECDTREQGLRELADCTGIEVSAMYLTEQE